MTRLEVEFHMGAASASLTPSTGVINTYQQAASEETERQAFSVQATHPIKDKRARLRVAARYIKMGIAKLN
jgi:hypothetical protein